MKKINLYLVDDHKLIRNGLSALLSSQPAFEVVGMAEDGQTALVELQQLPADIVLMDIAMPGMSGLEVAKVLLARPDAPRILLLTMHNSSAYIETALKLGVSGFLLKDASPQELFMALETIHKGQVYLSPAISGSIMQGFKTGKEPVPLTRRQIDILKRVALGHSTKEIAQSLNLSVKTVETHRSQIMLRLDIHDVTGLVRFAIRHQLIDC